MVSRSWRSAEGATIYVHGKPVCARCAGSIIQAGVGKVVAMHPDEVGKDSKWYETGLTAWEMFSEAPIQFHPKMLEGHSGSDVHTVQEQLKQVEEANA